MKKKIGSICNDIVFLAPALLCYLPILVFPFFFTLLISFTQWDGISANIDWNSIANYVRIFTKDADFRNALWFNLRLSATCVVLSNVLGLSFAVLLTNRFSLQKFGRTALILPNIMSGIVLGYIWKFIFTEGFPALGKLLGWSIFELSWLGTPATGFWGIVIVSVWQWAGYTMIIYMAGINGISAEVMESSLLDGANPAQRFFHVTLPLIAPSVTICIFWTLVRSLTMFDLPYALTSGGPFRSTETISMNIYLEAYTRNNYGLGAAKSMIYFILILVVSQLQIYFTRRKEVEL